MTKPITFNYQDYVKACETNDRYREALKDVHTKIRCTIESYEYSKTDENKRFIDGVIYGLSMASGSIEQVLEDTECE